MWLDCRLGTLARAANPLQIALVELLLARAQRHVMPMASAHYKAPDTDLAGTLWGAEAGGFAPTPKHSCKVEQHASSRDNDIAAACALARVRLPCGVSRKS
jgi:hypothetical protein